VLGTISSAKNKLLGPDAFANRADNFFERKVAEVYRHYQGMLIESSGMDFDDMLRLAVKLIEGESDVLERLHRQIRFLLVDEFQDTNHAQMRLIQSLAGSAANLTAVGDEDQGIYRWRGADLDNVLGFEKDFPGAEVRKLERNYRSTQTILTVAGKLVEHNAKRRPKRLWTDSGEGELVGLYKARDEQDESRWVCNALRDTRAATSWQEMAILVRTNAQTRAFEEELMRQQIPYELVGGVRFYERAEIKDLVAYLRVIRNPRDNFSLMRILNKPPRGIGKSTIEMLQQLAEEFGRSLWEALQHAEMGRLPRRSAKALEAFRDLLDDLREVAEEAPLPVLLERLVEKTDYLSLYSKGDSEAQAKRENVAEFLTAAQEFTESTDWQESEELLISFLDHVSLVSDIDSWQSDRGLSLMTLHSAKGLEFETVVVAGLEEGILPHFNAGGQQDDIEEERRLLYVGMTRAKNKLLLTCCRRRRIAGRYQDQTQSPFLFELPGDKVEVSQSPELFYDQRTSSAYSYFGRKAPSTSPPVDTGSGPGLRPGRRVRHATLGPGVVLDLAGEGDSQKLTVYFDRVGKRRLAAKYANLELL